MTTPHQPQPHTDGWIEWTGGKCPVDPRTKIQILWRSHPDKPTRIVGADWFGEFWDGDEIMAYRLAPSTTQSQTGRQSDV